MHGAEFEVLYKAMTEEQKKKVRDTLELADRILILGEYWSDFYWRIGETVFQSCSSL